MQIYFSSPRQMHDRGWGWISAYLKEGIVDPQGGTLNFHAYIGSDPAFTVNPQKYLV